MIPISSEMLDLLDGVSGMVEATLFEKGMLAETHGRNGTSWQDSGWGLIPLVGHVGDDQVRISVTTTLINGHKVLFWYPTSEVVDYRIIDAWLAEYVPEDGYANRTNASNFGNVLVGLERIAEKA